MLVKPAGSSCAQLLSQLDPACRDLIRQASLLGLTPEEILEALRRNLP